LQLNGAYGFATDFNEYVILSIDFWAIKRWWKGCYYYYYY